MLTLTCAKSPCVSCPYRRDVPSGVWHAHEYDKLPDYDGSIGEQVMNGRAVARFDCHQQNGKLCAGWIGVHGASNLLAMRLLSFNDGVEIDRKVWTYKSPVPLFGSGAEAAAHGKRAINRPGKAGKAMVARLQRKFAGRLKIK